MYIKKSRLPQWAHQMFRAIFWLACIVLARPVSDVLTCYIVWTLVCPSLCDGLTRLWFVVSRSLDSSHSTPSPLSSQNSSQDSLHKQPKKKGGFKSSLGRIFSKKEKVKKELVTRQLEAAQACKCFLLGFRKHIEKKNERKIWLANKSVNW